ncbi:MAG TPA: 4-alpha-glucanotransferase, partial [Thermoleophilaceae bacterium]|nr:4-alpha-glucanotransferase [Thermoleophilaceae bacterium]
RAGARRARAAARGPRLPRSAGVQLHPTSLPGGRLGDEAYRFVDWLASAGQTWWQMLPLGPPGEGGSPYKSPSAFAASPELLAEPDAPVGDAELAAFRERERYWIDDWDRFAGDGAAADQVRFDREWGALRSYAAERGVRLIGDMPIYVAPGGADHQTHPELFQTELVAGAPPDKFTDLGQLWGNPLYDWPALQRRRYAWWIERLRRASELYDVCRIDHFRAFVAYWAVPAGAEDARAGFWRRGPGRAPFEAARRRLGELPLIAENLGIVTDAVERLRLELGLPGMAVLQFAFDPEEPDNPHRLHNHKTDDVVYTGTHDHDTIRGWWESLPDESRVEAKAALERAGIEDDEPWWALIRVTFASPGVVAMVQMQDVLGLDSEARMNVPGLVDDRNWSWRLKPDALTPELAERLREATAEAGRLPKAR